MNQPELLQGPVRAPRSTPLGEAILDISLMISVAIREVPNNLNTSNSHGDSLLGLQIGVEAEVEVTLVFLSLEASKHINDNYSVPPPLVSHSCPGLALVKKQSHQEQNISCLNSKQSVSCINVVSPVLSATIPGQPQKKGIRPVQSLKPIKLVKGVSCVILSHFVPSVQSVPHVVTKTSVGGRLQSFWQVWQKLGSTVSGTVTLFLSGKGHISAAFP